MELIEIIKLTLALVAGSLFIIGLSSYLIFKLRTRNKLKPYLLETAVCSGPLTIFGKMLNANINKSEVSQVPLKQQKNKSRTKFEVLNQSLKIENNNPVNVSKEMKVLDFYTNSSKAALFKLKFAPVKTNANS
ncbi:MAG: hypothetical protein HXY49_08545 [Ignavibacteriaceae bacterium]|nr:hypothetical protein [Ignavibacteriaceae bacterium]